jgi:hypothetical protein
LFSRWFGRHTPGAAPTPGSSSDDQQAVLVRLDGRGLADDVYEQCDLATLEDRITEVIDREGLGEFDGNEVGPTETTLYMYGPDAEKLFVAIEPVLRAYPLCRGARVEIRPGGPGTRSREVRI